MLFWLKVVVSEVRSVVFVNVSFSVNMCVVHIPF